MELQQALTSTGDETQGIVSRLHVLPEMHIGVIEDVRVQVEVVEALRGQHHAHIITCNQHSWLVKGKLACITGLGENLTRLVVLTY